jgi:hypothetical protein
MDYALTLCDYGRIPFGNSIKESVEQRRLADAGLSAQ